METGHGNSFNGELLESIFRTSKKMIQEYVQEIERHNRYKTSRTDVLSGCILDDRSRLIDLYEACLQQDAHLRGVVETLQSQILGDRYMLARITDKGTYIKDVEYTLKIQNSQFDTIIKGIIGAKLYGYTLIEILFDRNTQTGLRVNLIERRNVLPDQQRVVKRQGIWHPNWDLTSPSYFSHYILVQTKDIGLFSATTPLILAKKFTLANYTNFAHTYALPIVHGKTVSESNQDRKRLADEIANAAQNRIIVTGIDDVLEVKAFTMSNSEKIYTGLIEFANKEVSDLILGSQSVAGEMGAYVGSTKAHQDIFRDRIEVYRRFVENVMNEEIVPRLIRTGYLKSGLRFKYSNRLEMNNEDRIKLYSFITDKYEVQNSEIEKEFGITVGRQLNLVPFSGEGSTGEFTSQENYPGHRRMSDEEYYKRYHHPRGMKIANFLRGME